MFLPTNITLKFGDSGDFVSELQRRLAVVQCFSESMINGFYDGNTANGVSRFQAMVGINADGVAGPETLRRLNGAISGDATSGEPTSNNTQAEEEERRRLEAEAYHQEQKRLEQQRMAELEQQRQWELQQQQLQQQAAQPAYQHPAYQQPATTQPAYEPQQYQQQQQYQPQAAQPYQPATAEMQPPVAGQPALQHTQQQPHAQAAPIHQQQQPYTPPPQTAAPVDYAALEQTAKAQAPAPEQQRGLVGRAIHYANEAIGKLASYFEAKLPRHVLDEVKQIGHVMAHSGVKEVAIPQGPEQQRDRGIEQQRGQQQGRQIS